MTFYDEREHEEAWDCDPEAEVSAEEYDAGLDEEDDEGDWQVLALDRFGDRIVNPGLETRCDEFAVRREELDDERREKEEFTRKYL